MYINAGCPYLANIHFRQVKRIMPAYPGIDDLTHLLDDTEVKFAVLRGGVKDLEVGNVALCLDGMGCLNSW